ncbi:MAG TPA: monofunctional biosynthetic peptidoglycan transglycosylase [Vicinamibacteria bacterium]|nr:monofunctional biosynthetic peptidoglycan transglycosylase [Vicinamibacteria bacterium]
MLRRALLLLLAAAFAYAVYVVAGLPSRSEVRALAAGNPGRTGVMRQREAEARAAGRRPRLEQTWVPLERISRDLIHALVAAEDQRFFGHEGVDWEAVRVSFRSDLEKGSFARGGSTISQQLVKNVFFTTDKSLTRKLRELLVVRWLEADVRKARILELYLNLIEWGDGVYGCEAAARRYYGRSAAELTAAEAAGLVAMIPNPRRINPRVSAARHARAQQRVLGLMARAGYLKRDLGYAGPVPTPEPLDESGPEPTEPPEPDPSP